MTVSAKFIAGDKAMYAEYCLAVAEESDGLDVPMSFAVFKAELDRLSAAFEAKKFVKEQTERAKVKRPTHPEASDMDSEERADLEFAMMSMEEKKIALCKCGCEGCSRLLFKLNAYH